MRTSNYIFLYPKNYLYSKPVKGLSGYEVGYGFAFNGQEKDDEVSGVGNTMTAEFWEYDSRLGRRWNIDPAFKEKPSLSVYQTFSDNPLLFVDPYGDNESPVFDKNGTLLGTDEQGMSGDVIVADDPTKFKQGMKHEDAKKLGTNFSVDRKDMTMEAKIKTVSKVIESTELPNGEKIKQTEFNLTLNEDPNGNGEYLGQDLKTGKYNINLSLKKEWTVENIRSVGGIHEIYGHGIMHWGSRFMGTGSHHKIYEAQMDSKYWGKCTLSMKKHIVNNYWKYLYSETYANSIPAKYEAKYFKYK